MKKLFTFFAFFATIATFAQAPQGFNYQATVRNSSGDLIVNQNVYFKFNVMLNSATSVPVYSETHYLPTDDLGQVNCTIGKGTATTGTFSSINWANGTYYLGIELNIGAGYVAMGTTQLLSVPYALYANSSGNSQTTTPNLAAVLAVGNGANNTKISNLADPTEAQDAVTNSFLASQVAQLQAQITALQNTSKTPSPPTNLTAVVFSVTQINLSWVDQSANETGFKIERRVAGTANYVVVGSVGADVLTFSDKGLSSSFSYDYRVYSFNDVGSSTTASNEVSLTTSTLVVVPALTTNTPSVINTTSASSGGTISSDGGADITARGVVWSTDTNPTISLMTKTTDGAGVGAFSSAISSLNESTTYYIRAYATNIKGTTYGDELSFTTLSDIPESLSSVTIGTQIWTNTDLDVAVYTDGTPIPEVQSQHQLVGLTTGAWCYYDNYPSNGKLYNWYAIAGIHDNDPNTPNKKLAPKGWRIPSVSDWVILQEFFVGGSAATLNKLKSTATSFNSTCLPLSHINDNVWPNSGGGNNESGFTGLPNGYRDEKGSDIRRGCQGYWWSSEFGGYLNLNAGAYDPFFSLTKGYFLSVRCLRY